MVCFRLLYLWEAETVRWVILWKWGRWRWWRVWQCSLYPGPRQKRPWREGRWGFHRAPQLRRVPYPLMSIPGWLRHLKRFAPQQACTFVFKLNHWGIRRPDAAFQLEVRDWASVLLLDRVPASVLLLPWKTQSNMDYWIGMIEKAAVPLTAKGWTLKT